VALGAAKATHSDEAIHHSDAGSWSVTGRRPARSVTGAAAGLRLAHRSPRSENLRVGARHAVGYRVQLAFNKGKGIHGCGVGVHDEPTSGRGGP
jgi:hypothetical protein